MKTLSELSEAFISMKKYYFTILGPMVRVGKYRNGPLFITICKKKTFFFTKTYFFR